MGAPGVAAMETIPVVGWPACSYAVTLGSVRKLTIGETDDDWYGEHQTFCVKS